MKFELMNQLVLAECKICGLNLHGVYAERLDAIEKKMRPGRFTLESGQVQCNG